jgi:hypothetical protein
VLLFDSLDRDAQTLRWVIFDEDGRTPEPVSSPLQAYEKLASRTQGKPPDTEFRVDRAWAVEAVKKMVTEAN